MKYSRSLCTYLKCMFPALGVCHLPIFPEDLAKVVVSEIERVQKLGRALDGQTKPSAAGSIIADAIRTYLPPRIEVAQGEIIGDKAGASSGECDMIVFDSSEKPHYWNSRKTIAFVDRRMVKAIVEWERRVSLSSERQADRLGKKFERLQEWTPSLHLVTIFYDTEETWPATRLAIKDKWPNVEAYNLLRRGELGRLVSALQDAARGLNPHKI